MKKIIYVFSIIILVVVPFVNKKKNVVLKDNIKYAINIDGKTNDSFPDKNLYTVNVNCENALGKWDYENWKMLISKISGNVSCKVDFNTVSKNYLNDYLINFVGTPQGDGQFVAESVSVNPGYNDTHVLTKDEYGTYEMYTSSDYWAETGESNSNAFEFTNGKWSNIPNNLEANKNYYIKFIPNSYGYYQLCYEMPAGKGEGIYIFTKGRKFYTSVYSLSDEEKYGCLSLNYNSNSEFIIIKNSHYSEAAHKINFYLKKANNPIEGDSILRYEGRNPNNYVWFNNEIWRIIGIFDETTHGQSNKKLVKIVKDESIGNLFFYKYNTSSNWSNSLINNLLNNNYLNSTDGTLSGNCISYYSYDSNGNISVYGNGICDYRYNGIKESYRKMISNSIWYNGSIGASNDAFDSLDSEKENPSSGYIGLMYYSDFKFGNIITDECPRDESTSNSCVSKNWIGKYANAHTLSKEKYSNEPISIRSSSSYSADSVHPTLYLNENVYVLDGDGSITDPYIISMDEA